MTEEARAAEGRSGRQGEKGKEEREATPVRAHRGFFPIVYGNEVEVSQGGGLIFIAKDELEIEQGGGQWMIGLRKLEVEQGGCMMKLTQTAEVSRGFIGLLASAHTELKDGSRVLMTLRHAVIAGLVAGGVVAAARLLRGRRRGGSSPEPTLAM